MTADELIGTWRIQGNRTIMTLHPDRTVTLTTSIDDESVDEPAEWCFLSERQWQLRITIPARADVPGLEEDLVEVIDYDVLSFDGENMTITSFDSEPEIYQRLRSVARPNIVADG